MVNVVLSQLRSSICIFRYSELAWIIKDTITFHKMSIFLSMRNKEYSTRVVTALGFH